MLDPQGRFLRSFGTQGIADGKFNYPWGVTTDALGFIYVCDKENHRVQVYLLFTKPLQLFASGKNSFSFILFYFRSFNPTVLLLVNLEHVVKMRVI